MDPRAIDPYTLLSLYLTTSQQSRDLCFALIMACAKDTKELYEDVFTEWFEFLKKIDKGTAFPAHDGLPELKNVCRVSTQDMSSFWKVLKLGGGSGSMEYFCHCCMCKKDQKGLYKVGDHHCPKCVEHKHLRCYCHPMCTGEFVQEAIDTVAKYMEKAGEDSLDLMRQRRKESRL